MKFAMFFMAEYANMIKWAAWPRCSSSAAGPALSAALQSFREHFLNAVIPLFWFVIKVFFFLCLYVWVRAHCPASATISS